MDIQNKDKIELILKNDDGRDESEISIREIIETIIKGKKIILWTTVTFFILAILGLFITNPYSNKSRAIVAFNFQGIEKGLDPKGKKFDAESIKAINVLSKVADKLDLRSKGITADDLRASIEIQPIIPGDVTEKVKRLEEQRKENIKELQSFEFYPNRFIVTYNAPKWKWISAGKTREILNEIIKQYEEDFYYTYTDREVLGTALGNISYEEYDYPEVSTVVHNQIDIIKNYLTAKNKDKNAAAFRSKRTSFTFNDIIESLDVINNVDVGRLDSIIGAFNLTKDREKLIKLYEYRIKRFELERAKKGDEAKIVADMLGKYQKDKNVVLMPGVTGTEVTKGPLEVENNDSSYYDLLSERYTNSGVASTNSTHEIAYYKKEIEKFQKDNVSQEMKKLAEKDIVVLINNIKIKLEKWIKTSNDTVQEYYEVEMYNQAIKKLSPAENYPVNEKSNMILGISILLGLIFGAVISFAIEYWKKSGEELIEKRKRERQARV